jgi:hypothetical protein
MQANIDRQSRLMAEQQLNQIRQVTGATALLAHERFVIVTGGGAAYNLTLPSVSEMRGLEVDIWFRVDAGFDVTVIDKGDSLGWANVVLNDAGDHLLCRSDGVSWHLTKLGVA